MKPTSAAPDHRPGRQLHGIDTTARFAGLETEPLRLLREAGTHLTHGRPDQAEQSLRGVFAAAPDQPEALRLQARIHQLHGRGADAIALLRRALQQMPDDALVLHHLGASLLQAGVVEEALPLLQRACELAPDLSAAWVNLGTAHETQGEFEQALAAFQQAVRCDPRHLPARIACGNGLRAIGRISDAVAQFREALAINPAAVAAWAALADLKTEPFSESETATLERLVVDPQLDERDRAVAGFALGKALEDQHHYETAFAQFNTANAIWRLQQSWDRAALGELAERMTDAFARTPCGADDHALGEQVIFVVSLPRSGSTLTEQILATHSQVEGAGERPELSRVIDEESRRRGSAFPAWVPTTSASDWDRLGRRYLRLTARWREQKPKSTDKALTSWLHLGAAHAMLPGAKFVNSRRDRLETAWSIYKHLFMTPQPFAYDLEDIAACWRDYDRLMCFWHARYPGVIHDHVYEDLVADPGMQTRRLLAFCKLPYERACLRFHETKRGVSTASAAQVRQPLRADTARAQLYGHLLDPLRRNLDL